MILARKINKIPEFYIILPIFPDCFLGEGKCPARYSPISYAYGWTHLSMRSLQHRKEVLHKERECVRVCICV